MNDVTLVGNLVDDPELRFTPAGVAMCRVRIAVNRRWKNNKTGEWEEEAHFFSGNCWRDLAENVAESLNKGDRVILHGRLQQRSWDTSEGKQRSVVEVNVADIGPSLRWATARPERIRNNRDNDRYDNRRDTDRRDNRRDTDRRDTRRDNDRYDTRRDTRDTRDTRYARGEEPF